MSPDRGRTGSPSPWRYLPLVVLIVALGAVFATGSHRYLSLDWLIEHRDRIKAYAGSHPVEALGLFMALYVVVVVLSLPASALMTMIGGFMFGWLLGLLAAIASATIGGIGIFLIVRTSLGGVLLRRAGPRIQKLAAGFLRNSLFYLLFLRLMPVVPFWVTNLAAAVFGVPLRVFILATSLGMLPVSLAFAVAGAELDEIVSGQQRARDACLSAGGDDCSMSFSFTSLITPEMIAVLAALGLLALVPVIVRRFYGAKVGDGGQTE